MFVGVIPPSVVIDTEHVSTTCVDPHPGLTTPPETSEATTNPKTLDTALYDQPMHRGRCVHVLYILYCGILCTVHVSIVLRMYHPC